MAQHYPWRLSGVKVQAVRTFGICESLCKQVRINIFASEALEKKHHPPPVCLAVLEQGAVISWSRQDLCLLI